MKKFILAFALASMMVPVFVQAATAASRNRPYIQEDVCMYPGYPCSEWTRDDVW
jgi:hypothetical protein